MSNFSNLLVTSFKNSFASSFWIKSSFSTFTQPLWMKVTPALLGLPAKKKRPGGDPQMMKLKAERKRHRLWKDIRRLIKMEKQLKPLEELEIPYKVVDNKELYLRERKAIPVEVLDEREELLRQWTAYKTKEHAKDLQLIDRIGHAQYRALEELLEESPELYKKAVEIDESFLPFSAQGVTRTPPIKDYFNPDGEYIDSSKTWDPPKLPDKKELKKLGILLENEKEEHGKKKEEKKERNWRKKY